MTEQLLNPIAHSAPEIRLIAGPPAPSPPPIIALMIVALSLAAPFVFLKDGTPSLLLGIAAVAIALAGIITAIAAARAWARRQVDAAIRPRVHITAAGITFHPTQSASHHFSWAHITQAHLASSAFHVQANADAPAPGRHAIRFGKLVTPRADIISALEACRPPASEPP